LFPKFQIRNLKSKIQRGVLWLNLFVTLSKTKSL